MSQMSHWSAGCVVILFASSAFADERETLKPLLDKAVKIAGIEKIQSARSWVITAKLKDRSDDLGLRSGTRSIWVQLPDHYRRDIEFNQRQEDCSPFRVNVVINGRKGWRKDVSGTEELSPDAVAAEKARLRLPTRWSRDMALLLDRAYELSSMAEAKVGDRVAVRIRATRKGEPPVYLLFDKETLRLLRTERRQADGQQAVTTYEDYREVDGIQIPHKWTFRTDGKVDHVTNVEGVGPLRIKGRSRPEELVFELVELKFANKLDAKLFDKP